MTFSKRSSIQDFTSRTSIGLRFFLGMITGFVLIAVLSYGYLRFGFVEIQGDIPVPRSEALLMRMGVHASVKWHAPELSNPIDATDENLMAGGKRYLDICAGCHGTPGRPQKYPTGLVPSPPQFPTEGTELTEAQVFWVAKNGIRRSGMFVFGFEAPDADLWRIATFVKHMDKLPNTVREKLSR